MQKQTKSILEELEELHNKQFADKDKHYALESRALNLMSNINRFFEGLKESYSPQQADYLEKKFYNAIKNRDNKKFVRAIRRVADTDE
jgi:molybdopterin converting factor small subunit